MKKLILLFVLALMVATNYAFAQQGPVLTATLHSDTPAGQALSANSVSVDMARIILTASGGDAFINGIYLAVDGYGGLNNFADIIVYDTVANTTVATYSTNNQSATPGLLQFTPITIGAGMSKTYLVRASLSSSAAGTVRLGFSGFTFATQATPALANFPVYGNAFTLPGATPVPTPTPTPVATLTPSASPTPSSGISVVQKQFDAAELNSLKDGDIVRANGNTAVFVIKIVGAKRFKRWMISPGVLGAYGIPFSRIRLVEQDTLDQFPDSHLMRRFGDKKIYELWDIKEGVTGSRRWVPTVEDFLGRGFDFDAVFTVNDGEYGLYTEGQVLKSPVR